MIFVTRISRVAEKYFACWVLLFAGVAIGFPKLFEWIGPLVAFLLGTVMFGMGLNLKAKDFQPVLKKPGIILIGLGAQFILMPSVAYILAKLLMLPPELAVGLILVGACPGGTASNVIVYLSRGDVPLSVAMTSLSTLLAPLLTPLWLWLLVGSWLPVEVGELVRSILLVVILPIFLGILVRYFLPLTVKKINPALPLVSVTAIVIILAGVVAANAESFTRSAWVVLIAVILHNSIGLFMGYWTARGFRLGEKQSRAIAIEVGMQNSGLGVALALTHFNPVAALPGALFSVWHNLSGALLSAYWSRKQEKPTITSSLQNSE